MEEQGVASKIHHRKMIEGLEAHLKQFEGWDEVHSINPGRIRPGGRARPFEFNRTEAVSIGFKFLARSGELAQDVYIVVSPNNRRGFLQRYAAMTSAVAD